MTEVYNLGRQDVRGRLLVFRQVLSELEMKMTEIYFRSREALELVDKKWLGLTDQATLKLEKPFLLLTADKDLWAAAAASKLPVLNWNHYREKWL